MDLPSSSCTTDENRASKRDMISAHDKALHDIRTVIAKRVMGYNETLSLKSRIAVPVRVDLDQKGSIISTMRLNDLAQTGDMLK